MLEDYPKEIILADGVLLTLRPIRREDEDGLYRFFLSLPERARRSLRHDVTDRRLIEKWCRELNFEKALGLVAELDSVIVGSSTLFMQPYGWERHIGEIRITIAPEFQQRGLGSLIVQEMEKIASQRNVEKLMARFVSTRESLISAFERQGFKQVAVLKNFVKAIHSDEYRDIVILVKELATQPS